MTEKNVKNVGTLIDFVADPDGITPLDIQISVNDTGKVVIFHDRAFSIPISMFEYDINNNNLSVTMGDDEQRDTHLDLFPEITKHMQNTHQILTILMDNKTGEAIEGRYVPLILHS